MYSIMKATIIERFNRILNKLMWNEFSINGSYKWIDILSQLTHQYNNTKHLTTKKKYTGINLGNEKRIEAAVK